MNKIAALIARLNRSEARVLARLDAAERRLTAWANAR